MSKQRLIDANALLEYLVDLEPQGGQLFYQKGIEDSLRKLFPQIINDQSTIDPETLPIVKELRAKLAECEPKHGHWIACEDFWGNTDPWKCSCCGCNCTCIEGTPSDNNMKYCPECGAKMDKEV